MQTHNDLGTLTIGGTSFLATLEDVQWSWEGSFDEILSPTRFRAAGQPMKSNARFTMPLKSVKSGQNRVSHLDLSASALAGLDVRPELESLTLKVTNQVNPIPNIGEFKARYQTDPGGTIGADLALQVADSASVAVALSILMESDDPADLSANLGLTLNGVGVNVPGHMRRNSHNIQGRQKVTVGFEGSDPSGVYPTAPTGNSTILERAINASRTPLAFTYVSKLVGGLIRTGHVLIESAEVAIADARIVRESYAFRVSEPWETEEGVE